MIHNNRQIKVSTVFSLLASQRPIVQNHSTKIQLDKSLNQYRKMHLSYSNILSKVLITFLGNTFPGDSLYILTTILQTIFNKFGSSPRSH